jgi:hypothetical protein
MTKPVALPEPVACTYRATAELEAPYRGGKFRPDGHLVGPIGEVIAAGALGLTLYPMTAIASIAMYGPRLRLVVLRVVSPEEAEIVYDGPGQPVWEKAGKAGKNAQRVVRLSRLRAIAASIQPKGTE